MRASSDAELPASDESLAEENAANITSLGNIPLVVMVAGRGSNITATAPPGLLSNKTLEMVSKKISEKMHEDRIQWEKEFVKLSPQDRLIIAERAAIIFN